MITGKKIIETIDKLIAENDDELMAYLMLNPAHGHAYISAKALGIKLDLAKIEIVTLTMSYSIGKLIQK